MQDTAENNLDYLNGNIPKTIPASNSEEKITELNRILEVFTSRKKWGIVVAMIYVYKQNDYQKLLKDYLIQQVQELIEHEPFKVVSYNGVPFTPSNCYKGMRVIIGKHKIFQKEEIEGVEYITLNLLYASIFLQDENDKIHKGQNKSRPVHQSLIDEPDIEQLTFLSGKRDRETEVMAINKSNTNYFQNKARDIRSKQRDLHKPSISNINIQEENKEYGPKDSEQKDITKGEEGARLSNGTASQKKTVIPFMDFLEVWDFGKTSPVNIYLKENIQNIDRMKTIFEAMEKAGKEGSLYIEKLKTLIPESVDNSNANEEIDTVFKNYESEKSNLVEYFKRMQSTISNILLSQPGTEKEIIEEDIDYLNENEKLFTNNLKELFPIFDKIYTYNQKFSVLNITNELNSVNKILKDNEIVCKTFTAFLERLTSFIPLQATKGNSLCNAMINQNQTVQERKEYFMNNVLKDKENLLNIINPLRKKFQKK